MTLEEWAAKYVRGPVLYAKEYDEAIEDLCATLRDQGWRVVKLEEATFEDGHLDVTILHGTHNIIEELT